MTARAGSWRTALASLALLVGVAGCAGDDAADGPAPDEPTPDETVDTTTTSPAGPPAWEELEPAPLPLTEIDAAAFDGELWTVGGFAEDGAVTTDVQIFDPRQGSWRSGPELPAAVHHASLVATDRHLVVIGGYAGRSFEPVAEVFVLDTDGPGWRAGSPLPAPRGAGGAAWDGERIVYGGGVGGDGLADEVWALDDPDGEWTEVGRLSIARDHLDATSDGEGRVWFLAGRALALTANLGTVDLVSGQEVRHVGDVPTPRGGVAAFYSEQHGACVAGGERPDATFAEVECIDADGSVTTLPPLGVPRHGLGADVIDGVAYVALGGPEPLLAVSATVEALDLTGSPPGG